jgi:hypothetical protein
MGVLASIHPTPYKDYFMLKWSKANNKIKALSEIKELQTWLTSSQNQVWSLDLLSGHSCPYAKECLSKVEIVAGKRKVVDGPDNEFRCFSASQEALFPYVYKNRKHNYDCLKSAVGIEGKYNLLSASLPKKAGIIRIHVGGDFFNQEYFDAWVKLAENNPDRLFYAYTKSLPFWLKYEYLPWNFVLTASKGGHKDKLIEKNNLREVVVLADPIVVQSIMDSKNHDEYGGLAIDHDDSHAAVPEWGNENFYLLIHGTQPAGSSAGKANSILKGVGSYGK